MGGSSKGGGPKIKPPPPLQRSYPQGVQSYLANQPQLLAGEQAARSQYDPQRIAEQQQLQSAYGPTQYSQQLSALSQLDPEWMAAHGAAGSAILNPLLQIQRGESLMTPSMRTQLQQSVRGAQDARGNILGPGAGVEEAYAQGDREHQLEQQAIQNAEQFLGGPQQSGMIQGIAPVAADRSAAYIDPNAGFQWLNAANARYGANVAAQAANNTPGANPWGSVGSAIGSGVAAYYTGGNPQAIQAGSATGGQVGNWLGGG